MVKPQGKVRPEFSTDPSDGFGRPSLDSYHAEVLPRSLGGAEVAVRAPDFVVVKASASRDDDWLLLVVEVKLADFPEQQAVDQLIDYLEAFLQKHRVDTDKPLVDDSINGLVVMGDKVIMVSMKLDGSFGVAKRRPFDHPTVHSLLSSTRVGAL